MKLLYLVDLSLAVLALQGVCLIGFAITEFLREGEHFNSKR